MRYFRSKLDDFRGELDASLQATNNCRQKCETEERRAENAAIEARAAQRRIIQMNQEREYLQAEISRLKGAFN